MKQTKVFLLISILLGLVAPIPVRAQTYSLTIEILDKESHLVSKTVDGNSVQIRVTLSRITNSETTVDFFLERQSIGSCVIATKQDTCTTDLIKTLGWFYGDGGVPTSLRKIQARTGKEVGEFNLNLSPRPVVLVHGLISTSEKFNEYLGYLESIGLKGYAVGDGQFDGKLNMGDLNNPAKPTLTIAENAAQLDVYIEGVKQASGAEHVDLIAHSMGGLVSRYYIHELMIEDDVAQLIMLGTPNGGSSCGGLISRLGFFLPATLELQPAYINEIFNQQITNARGVPFHAIAGSLITDPAFSPCSGVPSDSSVSQESVETIPLHLAGLPTLEHNFLVTDEAAFREFVQPLLQTPINGFVSSSDRKPAFAPKAEQFTQTFSGHLNKNNSTSITIEIDSNVSIASFGLYDSTQSLQISVQGASGKILELDLENKGIVITDPETMLYLGYGFESPKPGAWVVTLSTSERTPITGADYALYARFSGGAKLNAHVDELIPQIGKTVNLFASIDSGQIESVRANILLPNGEREQVQLSASGNQFTAKFTPKQIGLYAIEIIVSGITADGFRIDRASSLILEAQPAPPAPICTWAIYLGILAGILIFLALPIIFFSKLRRKK